jgi:hypothetical protein
MFARECICVLQNSRNRHQRRMAQGASAPRFAASYVAGMILPRVAGFSGQKDSSSNLQKLDFSFENPAVSVAVKMF